MSNEPVDYVFIISDNETHGSDGDLCDFFKALVDNGADPSPHGITYFNFSFSGTSEEAAMMGRGMAFGEGWSADGSVSALLRKEYILVRVD